MTAKRRSFAGEQGETAAILATLVTETSI